ncbi:hypothetical protein LG198_11135 [Methylobacillus arboreus]|uniref:hypothetical protein n=1 Tax=Methylobacillus arboreus TaxID=755170 RepID=UPI001E482B36|nr:hypothetical protein [Methylobacillus arboreus]MCB5191281.1 hypothetical protein [Methylobacillus arboreus]
MYKSMIKLLFISATGIAALSACSMAGYQKIEEMSLPRYQTGTPVMSDIKVMCRAQVIVKPDHDRHMVDYTPRRQRETALTDKGRLAVDDRIGSAYFLSQNAKEIPATDYTHPPLDFMVTYDRIWDVTVYPTPPRIPPKYPQQLCQNGTSTQVITTPGIGSLFTQLEPDYKYDVRLRYNLDPSKGAVRVWRLPNVSMDGLNYRATMVGFMPMIIEGDKLPTGSNFKEFTNPHTQKEIITINGREWQHMTLQVISGRDVPAREDFKAGESSTVHELYTTKVGNYIFAMVAIYDRNLATHAPDWLAQRQAFLRHWLESFKFEPISPNVE